MTKRTIERKTRYNPDEDARLHLLADRACLDVASYTRFMAIGPTAGARLPNEKLLAQLILEMRRVGQQITPIAKAAAAGKYQGEQVPTLELARVFENTSKSLKREIQNIKRLGLGLDDEADDE